MFKKSLCGWIGLAVLTVPMTSWATDDYETVLVTAKRHAVDPAELAGNLTMIDGKSIDSTSHVHISEIAAQSPGVWISRGNGQEHLTAIRSPVLTGAGGCGGFLMAADGVGLRSAGFCNLNQLFEANSEQARQIDVIRGPGGSYYGSNAMHGVINVINQPAYRKTQSNVGLELGPYDYGRVKFRTEQVEGDDGWFAAGNYAHDGGYKDSSGFEQGKLSLGLRHNTETLQIDHMVGLTWLDQQTAGFISGEEAYKDQNRKKENPNPDAYRKSHSARWQARIQGEHEKGQWQITPYARHTEMEFLQHFVPWQPVEENGHSSAGVQSSFHAQLDDALAIAVGLDLEYTQGFLKETQAEDFAPHLPQGAHYDYKVKAQYASPFVDAQYRLSDRWELSAGLRYDYTEYEYNNQLSNGSACDSAVTNCRYYRPADSNDSFSEVSPNAGLVFSPTDQQQFYVSAKRGFRAPQTTELYRLQNGQENTQLNSVRLDSLEAGWRLQRERLESELVFFTMEKNNLIFQDTDRQNIDGGETTHKGVELALRLKLTEQSAFNTSATYARHRYANDISLSNESLQGNDVDTAPQWLGWAELDWRVNDNIATQLEWVHMDEYFLDPENNHQYVGHDLLNLKAQWQVAEALKLQARVTNLTDVDYAERADFGFGSYRYFVGQPRGLYLSVDYSL